MAAKKEEDQNVEVAVTVLGAANEGGDTVVETAGDENSEDQGKNHNQREGIVGYGKEAEGDGDGTDRAININKKECLPPVNKRRRSLRNTNVRA